jgi:hypothetical protein
MKNVFDELFFSASDLSKHLACSHATALDCEVATGHRESPNWQAPDLWILQERGRLHEEAYVICLGGLIFAGVRMMSGRFQDAIPGLFGALFGAGVLGWGAGWISSLTGQTVTQ